MMARLRMLFFPSPTIAWYTARMFLTRTVAFLAGLVLVLMTLDLLGESGRILAVPGNGEAELWHYVSLRLPQIIALFLPFSVLLAALLVFVTLNQNSEITIFKGIGLSAHQILFPFLAAALLVAGANFLFNERILMRANANLAAWKAAEYHPVTPAHDPTTETWVRVGENLWHALGVTGTGARTTLHDVTIYMRTNGQLDAIYKARTAVPVARGWKLSDTQEFSVGTGNLTAEKDVTLPSTADPQQFTATSVNGDQVSFVALRSAIYALKDAGKPVRIPKAKLYHKISGPLSAVLMPLLASIAAFGLARSGGLFIRAVIGLALGFAFFVMDNFAMAMAEFGTYSPIVAAWGPFLLFLLVGETLLIRSEE